MKRVHEIIAGLAYLSSIEIITDCGADYDVFKILVERPLSSGETMLMISLGWHCDSDDDEGTTWSIFV